MAVVSSWSSPFKLIFNNEQNPCKVTVFKSFWFKFKSLVSPHWKEKGRVSSRHDRNC